MNKFLSIALLLAGLAGCKKEAREIVVVPAGVYAGTFQRQLVWSVSDTAHIIMTFSANTWSGTSDKSHYPALCNGTYSVWGDTIAFKNQCAWTAGFDWSYILSGKYLIKTDGNAVEFYKDYRSATSDTWVDRYKLKRAEN